LHFRRIMPYFIASLTYQVGQNKRPSRNRRPSSGGQEDMGM